MLLVWVDFFSKFVWLALRDGVFSTFSVPRVFISHDAKWFISQEFKQFCFGLGTKYVSNTPYYTQPSCAERFNRYLRSIIIAYYSDSQTSWKKKRCCYWSLPLIRLSTKQQVPLPLSLCFPFELDLPFSINGRSRNSSQASVRELAFVSCGLRCAANCFVSIRQWPNSTKKGGYLTIFMWVI
jgi:hypothetical protein